MNRAPKYWTRPLRACLGEGGQRPGGAENHPSLKESGSESTKKLCLRELILQTAQLTINRLCQRIRISIALLLSLAEHIRENKSRRNADKQES